MAHGSSKKHAMIYWNEEKQSFCIKSICKNAVRVNGVPVLFPDFTSVFRPLLPYAEPRVDIPVLNSDTMGQDNRTRVRQKATPA